jgi:hypothetical protein
MKALAARRPRFESKVEVGRNRGRRENAGCACEKTKTSTQGSYQLFYSTRLRAAFEE